MFIVRLILMLVDENNECLFRRIAKQLGVMQRLWLMQGQKDVSRFMLGADCWFTPRIAIILEREQ